jgi:radical SAM-linked protein
LGFGGERESMDIKLEDDVPAQELIDRLNSGLPDDIKIFDVTEPVMKPGKIAFAAFHIIIDTDDRNAEEVVTQIKDLLNQEEIVVPKHTKSGMRDINIKPYFSKLELTVNQNEIIADIILPAGSMENINPMLFHDAIKKYLGLNLYTNIVRTNIFDENLKIFE